MARLTCIAHKARVLVLETKTIHRANGETCTSLLKHGEKKFTAAEVRKTVAGLSVQEQTIHPLPKEK
jgi:hypothetical protein